MRAPALSDESVRVHEGVRSADKIENGGGGARGVGGSDCLWVRARSFPHHHPGAPFHQPARTRTQPLLGSECALVRTPRALCVHSKYPMY